MRKKKYGHVKAMMPNEWIARVRDLAHKYKCWREYNDEMEMHKLERARKAEERKSFSFSVGRICDKIKLLDTVMHEHEDISKALYEYAAMLERLSECRVHMIPHKRDTEIIDYIETGKRHGNTSN